MTKYWTTTFTLAAVLGMSVGAVAQAQVCDPCGAPGACDVACDAGCGSSCGSYCGSGLLGGCDLGDPWKAFDCGPCSPWDIGGWIQMGYHTAGQNNNPALPGGGVAGTGMFNNYPDNFQLHQAWLYAERVADTGGSGMDWGFRGDFVYGTDGPDTQAFGGVGWDNGWDNGAQYGSALPQLYATVAYNDLSVKIGHFYTIVGYEVVTAPDNFFYSHAYTMYNAEPFTHSGVLAEWAVNDNVTAWGGWTAGWDTGFESVGGNTFLGGLSLQLTDNLAFTYCTTIGNFSGAPGDSGYSHSLVFDLALTDKLNYVFQSDLIANQGFLGAGPGNDTVFGINQYLLYAINDCWGAGARVEWYQDDRLNGFPENNDLGEITLGLNYRPHANFVVRPEVRWDLFGDGIRAAGYQDSTMFGIDCVLTF